MRPQSTWVPVWDLPVRLFHWALVLCVSVDLTLQPERGCTFWRDLACWA